MDAKKRIEKLEYMHRNSVKPRLLARPEDWPWSSFRHYMSGEDGAVKIESAWTVRMRQRVKILANPYSQQDRTGACPEQSRRVGPPPTLGTTRSGLVAGSNIDCYEAVI